ncbi:MAG: DUF4412 domain-containing protein [Polyangiales bacterium]
MKAALSGWARVVVASLAVFGSGWVMFTATPASAFEGEIDAKATGESKDEVVDFTIFVSKKGDTRIDTTTKGRRGNTSRTSYIKPATGKSDYIVDHSKKQAIGMPKSMIRKMAEQQQSGGNSKPNVEVKKLGTETVAGQPTRHVQIIDKDTGDISDVWMTDRYPVTLWQQAFSMGSVSATSPTGEWTRLAKETYGVKPGFFMKMVSKSKRGASSSLEVMRIEDKRVAPDTFKVPPGYKSTMMPDMSSMQNMQAPSMPQ